MSRLTRDGTAEPVSRDQILRHARGQGNISFPVQLTTSRIGNLTRLIHTLLYVMTIHTYIHTYMHVSLQSWRVCTVHCLAWSEVQVIQILFVSCRVCFVVLVHEQLRCASNLIISVSEYDSMYVCMYVILCVCMYVWSSHIARVVWINRG